LEKKTTRTHERKEELPQSAASTWRASELNSLQRRVAELEKENLTQKEIIFA